MKPDRIVFRKECPADAAAVRRAHASHWIAPPGFDLPADLLARLLEQQHILQERHIAAVHPDADRRMIVADDIVVGRICLNRTTLPWQIVDLALAIDAQGIGIGWIVLDAVIDEAAHAGAAIALEVARNNVRAQTFYQRSGFQIADGESCTHFRMIWEPRQANDERRRRREIGF